LKIASNYNNIEVTGEYVSSRKEAFLKEADMLMYYYPCNFNCNRALANKYYDGLIYKLPLIGNERTYSGRLLSEKKIGISIRKMNAESANAVYSYYACLNKPEYLESCDQEIGDVIEEDRLYIERIRKFVK
jgi:hypothetical protein